MLDDRTAKFVALCWEIAGYNPSPEQEAFHNSQARLRLVAGGVRAGKSFSTARECDKHTLAQDGLGWLVGPDYEQCRPEFEYLLSIYSQLGVVQPNVSFPSRGPCSFTTSWGFKWQTKSSSDPISLASYAPNVLVMCEAAQQTHESYLKCLERTTQKNAPLILSGTFESSLGWYAEMWEKWQGSNPEGGVSFSIPTWSNRKEFPGGREDHKILAAEASMSAERFQERYGGIPCKPAGLVFPQFDRRRHMRPLDVLFDPKGEVEVWVDPAFHCYAVLFVQRDGNLVKILDEVYMHNTIAQAVIPVITKTRWWEHSCNRGVIDIAAKQRHANVSQIEVWQETLRKLGTHGVNWETHRVREEVWREAIAFRLDPPGRDEPLLLFADHLNAGVDYDGRARGIIGELATYKWRPYNEGRAVSERPVKANEDALSALGYGLFHYYGAVESKQRTYTVAKSKYWV